MIDHVTLVDKKVDGGRGDGVVAQNGERRVDRKCKNAGECGAKESGLEVRFGSIQLSEVDEAIRGDPRPCHSAKGEAFSRVYVLF
jgi:hypothetical protein